MIIYSTWLIFESAKLLDDNLLYLNFGFLLLIFVDGYLIVWTRKGLEDRWCSLSIVYFICACSAPFWLIEISSSVILAKNVFSSERSSQLQSHYKELSSANIVVYDENHSTFLKEIDNTKYLSIVGKQEAFFCLVLIFSRIFIPQATLTWSTISSQSEFAFNTIFDIYSTLTMLKDSRINLPNTIWVLTYIVCNAALYPIALNVYDTDSSLREPCISHLRKLTNNSYFRLFMQIALADLPFLVLRLIMLANLRYVRREMYYLIVKQVIIIFCKLGIMAYDWCRFYIKRLATQEIKRINELHIEWKIK